MDIVNVGLMSFVSLILIGGSIAYFVAPQTVEVLVPDLPAFEGPEDSCKWDDEACAPDREGEDEGDDDDEDEDDEDDDGERPPREKRGKGHGKDGDD